MRMIITSFSFENTEVLENETFDKIGSWTEEWSVTINIYPPILVIVETKLEPHLIGNFKEILEKFPITCKI